MPIRLAPLVVIAVVALLAGCGDSPSDDSSTSGSSTQTEEAQAPAGPVGAAAKSCKAHSAGAESLRATEISCDQARRVMYGWQREPSCSLPTGVSRASCQTRSYRCLATGVDRGISVSCAGPGQSIAFIARR